ncbi:MAG: hypothetical protein JO299_09845 [Gammaproteobacteria bacterium]|nr:hypothetical protein [Gammaproteobacteria bacterium]
MTADRDFTVMQDFIGGRLSEAESRDFEKRLVREPALVRELEHSLRMREGLRQLRTRAYIRTPSAASPKFRTWISAGLAAAAIAGLALFLSLPRVAGTTSVLAPSLEKRAGSAASPRVAAHFTFVSMRAGAVPDLELPAADRIEIRAAPSARQMHERYRVTLVRWDDKGAARTIAALTDLAVGTDGYVHCYADAARLTPGSYVLRVQPDGATSAEADVFPFNLNAPGSGSSR